MTDRKTVRLVVWLLGANAIILAAGYIWLLRDVIHQASNRGPVDSATLGAIAALGPLVGAALGGLGALLASTRTHDMPQEVTVENTPLPVEDTEAGHADFGTVLVMVAVAIIVAIFVNEVFYDLSL